MSFKQLFGDCCREPHCLHYPPTRDGEDSLLLGIDPGGLLGAIALQGGRYVGHATVIKPGRRVREDHADQEMRFVARIADALAPFADARLVVIERPEDGAVFWTGRAGQTRQRTGTAFMLGAHYLAALVAVQQACRQAKIVTYPVLGNSAERGWMPRKTKREALFSQLTKDAITAGAPPNLSDHCLAAYGVLRHHLASKGLAAA